MTKYTFLIILLLLLVARLALAQTVNYQISVTIPAIIGVNVPGPTVESTFDSNAPLESHIEEVVRNDARILLETIVIR